MLYIICLGLFASVVLATPSVRQIQSASTRDSQKLTARVANGTYEGFYSSQYDQDIWLGIPFAQPPTGDLRFCPPQSLNTTFSNTKPAQAYSPECVGYGSDDVGYDASEDCLYLNVVRPAAQSAKRPLPVAVWIYGGGYVEGGTVDRRYNLSFIVDNSAKIGTPIIGVSINYRMSFWGFPYSEEVRGAGLTNLGLRDQRLALHWIQENIGAFGGDPEQVTIWGESAGASSVGFHLLAYGGRDDGLFRAAIMESGNPVPFQVMNGTRFFQPLYDNITAHTQCDRAIDTLDCLRRAPFELLNAANNNSHSGSWFPVIDGDFLQRYPSQQLAAGDFVSVPLISGANSDEGASFAQKQKGINTTADFRAFVASTSPSLPRLPDLLDRIEQVYPDDPCIGVPVGLGCKRLGPPYGAQFRRAAAFGGDFVFIANRRQTCEVWAAAGVPAYCYRFDARPNNYTADLGVMHFQEVAFVFDNTDGLGYAVDPFADRNASYPALASFMSRNWASFVATLDPNAWRAGADTDKSLAHVPSWPRYAGEKPENMVFDAAKTGYIEADTFRAEGIRLINDNSLAWLR